MDTTQKFYDIKDIYDLLHCFDNEWSGYFNEHDMDVLKILINISELVEDLIDELINNSN